MEEEEHVSVVMADMDIGVQKLKAVRIVSGR